MIDAPLTFFSQDRIRCQSRTINCWRSTGRTAVSESRKGRCCYHDWTTTATAEKCHATLSAPAEDICKGSRRFIYILCLPIWQSSFEHHSRLIVLAQMLMSTRIAREARVKTEGHKYLQRNRALEEDEEFMARATAGDQLEAARSA